MTNTSHLRVLIQMQDCKNSTTCCYKTLHDTESRTMRFVSYRLDHPFLTYRAAFSPSPKLEVPTLPLRHHARFFQCKNSTGVEITSHPVILLPPVFLVQKLIPGLRGCSIGLLRFLGKERPAVDSGISYRGVNTSYFYVHLAMRYCWQYTLVYQVIVMNACPFYTLFTNTTHSCSELKQPLISIHGVQTEPSATGLLSMQSSLQGTVRNNERRACRIYGVLYEDWVAAGT